MSNKLIQIIIQTLINHGLVDERAELIHVCVCVRAQVSLYFICYWCWFCNEVPSYTNEANIASKIFTAVEE